MNLVYSRLSGLVVLFLLSFSLVRAQFVYIPDSAFRSFLISDGYAPAFNGDSLDTTSVLVTTAPYIFCSGRGIQSLEGLQYFDQLLQLDCSVNYLTNLPPLPSTMNFLDCSKNLLSSLVDLPPSLVYLYCGHNPLYNLPALPLTLQELNCQKDELVSLPTLPPLIEGLLCDSNFLQSLPTLPVNLTYIYCSSNLLDSLPEIPNSLRILISERNQLTSLPVLPDSLLYLIVSYNPLNQLPSLPSQLYSLGCDFIGLDSLPQLPSTLELLSAQSNNLIFLPPLPQSLRLLWIRYNNIDSISNQLPSTLESLMFDNNPVSTMPVLPQNLSSLCFSSTRIRTIPGLPPNLQTLYCNEDSLTSLPNLPSSINYLSCGRNLIQELPTLPDSMMYLMIYQNPIRCLPSISYVGSLDFTNTLISCLPNSISFDDYIYPSITNFPLCQPSSGCPVYWNISGNIFHDLNADCVRDTNEQELKNIPVLLDSAGTIVQIEYTNTNGDYSFRAPLGNYFVRINPTNFPVPLICPASGVHAVQLTPIDSLRSNLDFGFNCPSAFDLIASSIGPETMFRPTRRVKVIANAGDFLNRIGTACFTDSGYVECNFNGPITYDGPSIGAMSATFTPPSTLRWNVNDFTTIDPTTDFNFDVLVDSFAQINDPICFQLGIYPFVGDIFPFDNFINSCYPVRVAIDPNEKFMSPSGSVDTSDHIFNFTVFFQNTGNAPAEDIFILDTLDNDLDASTFEFISSTHPVVTQLLSGNVLRFNFHGINLVDSVSNEPQSHGHVNFRLRRKATTGMGTEISNTAYIFFDQNAGVVTNTVSAIITSIVGVSTLTISTKLTIYPNPTNSIIRTADVCDGKGIVEIKNLYGEVVSTTNLNNGEYINTNVSDYIPGLYFISLIDNKGKRISTFVKQ